MAGKKNITRKKTSPKRNKQLIFSAHTHIYRQHLIKYALEKKRSTQGSEKTITVRSSQGLIFSAESQTFKQIADTLKSTLTSFRNSPNGFSSDKTSFRSRRSNRRRSFYQKVLDLTFSLIISILRFFNLCGTVSQKILVFSLLPFKKTARLIARWNRKQSWSFRREISHQDVPITATVAQDPLAETTQAVIRPFYYTVRLFPLHTFIALFLSFGILGVTWATHEYIFKDLPDPHDLTRVSPPITTKILDRNGEVLFRLYEDENRTIVPLTHISPYVLQATVAIEDKEFYSHRGFSIRGISRALVSNYKGLPTQGGSTITQQLVKNRLLSSEQTVRRKIREAIVAVLTEGIYEKNHILEMYLNQVAYGGSTYGIEEASHRYFGKTAAELSLAESALIAGLPAAPSAYTPFGPNPEFAKARQVEVLRRMVEDGYISQEQSNLAAAEELHFVNDVIDIQAPHFVMYVKKLLAEEYGEELLYQGGLEIRTTLDLKLQNDVQKKVTDEVNQLASLKVSNGAALVTNPKTGEIFAMVGSKDYFDFEHDGQVNVTIRPRQPGSSIKPLTYAIALEKGQTVTSTIEDQPITFDIAGSKPYTPKNYDGTYHGRVTLKESLASSYNIPAVKLLHQIGVNTLIDKAEDMGITTWNDRRRFGLSLTLGGGEVLMTDMAKAYGAFANEGYVTDLNPVLEIYNYKGELIYENTCALEGTGCFRKKVLDNKVAYLISNILSDNDARTPAFGPMSTLFIPGQEVAVKTGTTNNMRDNWTFGFTSDRLVSVWVGNNDNQPMSYVASGVTGASSIWNKIMTAILDKDEPHIFPVPDGIVKVASCRTGNNQLCSCNEAKEEYYIAGTEPKNSCNIAQRTIQATPVPIRNNRENRRRNLTPLIERVP